MSSKIKVIVETLAKDGTNPEVNKKAIVELGNEADAIPNVESAQAGTIDKVLGLDANGKLVKGDVSGGTKLYRHVISFDYSDDDDSYTFLIHNTSNEPLNTLEKVCRALRYNDSDTMLHYVVLARGSGAEVQAISSTWNETKLQTLQVGASIARDITIYGDIRDTVIEL